MSYHFYQPPITSRLRHSEQCPPMPECRVCGGLECLCRPRFFAGQLLTEDDLNRLQHYIVEKNKLHNRYLHGWGVVCGLEAVCSPCQNGVHVKSGYALSPCGSDITVCKDDDVDVCALIQACRPVSPYADCEPPGRGGDEACQDVTEEWVLAICYDEKPSRGITALRGSSGAACCSRCNCGGASTCGCGCHSPGHASANTTTNKGQSYRSAQRNPPPQCEPTLTCEGYFYHVYKAPKRKDERRDPGALVTRVLTCLNELTQHIATLPGTGSTPFERFEWCCSFKQSLQDLLVTQGIYDCLIADRLANVKCPDPSNQNTFESEWQNTLQQLAIIVWEFIKYCFCSALLPPCPEPTADDCVPLATVTVRRRDCRILQVCNWGPRKFAISLPNLGYWLSILTPYAQSIREAIERICCHPLKLREVQFAAVSFTRTTQDPLTAGITATSSKMSPEREFMTLLYESLLNPERGFDAQSLLVLNTLGAADSEGNRPLSELESRNPLQFLLLNQVVAPLIRSSLPEQPSDVFERAGLPGETSTQAAELKRLRRSVNNLQKQINVLRSRLPTQ